jgi:predicted RND superfamily exporter protein
MALSYYGYEKIIITKKNLLPDFSNLSNELWIVIIIFIYQIVNKIESSNESTIVRKDNYLYSKYRLFQKKYGRIIIKLKNKRLIALAYSILIYENFNRPYIARLVENIRFHITSKPHTLGIMQVYSNNLINDTESVRLGVEKIMRDYNEMVANPKEDYIDESEYSGSEYSILNDLIAKYNGGSEYREGVIEVMRTIEEKYCEDDTDRLTDGFK